MSWPSSSGRVRPASDFKVVFDISLSCLPYKSLPYKSLPYIDRSIIVQTWASKSFMMNDCIKSFGGDYSSFESALFLPLILLASLVRPVFRACAQLGSRCRLHVDWRLWRGDHSVAHGMTFHHIDLASYGGASHIGPAHAVACHSLTHVGACRGPARLTINHNRPSKFRSVMKLAPVSFQFTKCVFRRLLYSALHTSSAGLEASATPYGQTPTRSVLCQAWADRKSCD